MSRKYMKLIAIATVSLSLVACGTNDEVKGKSTDKSQVSQGDSKPKEDKIPIMKLNSKDEFRKYADETISKYETYFNENGIVYTKSPDNQILMNKETKHVSMDKEYNTVFSVSVGADVTRGVASTTTTTYVTSHIDDKYTKEDKNIVLAFHLLNNVKHTYKNLDQFVEALNTTVSEMTLEDEKRVLQDNESYKVYLQKESNEIKLFIITSKNDEITYGKIKPMEFSTYEDYKKLMLTTNTDIFNHKLNNIYNGGHPNNDGTLDTISEFGIKHGEDQWDKYSYGISNAQNLNLETGDFKIEFVMNYDGRPENFHIPVELFSEILKEKVDYVIDKKELENYLLSNIELSEHMDILKNNDDTIDSYLAQYYPVNARYITNGLPFEGMVSSGGFDLDGKTISGLSIEIPAIVEGKTRR